MHDFDAAGIGYRDTLDFSYRGGTTRENDYKNTDTYGDLYASGKRLEELIRRVHREHPGVPIDVFAHSQGGILSRIALGELGAEETGVANLVTLATPHDGSDIAFIADRAKMSLLTHEVAKRGAALADAPDMDSIAAEQLRPGSPLFARIKPMPASVRMTSISSATDAIVAGSHTRLPGRDNRIVDVPGSPIDAHSEITRAESARREAWLAVAGMGATCKSWRTYIRQRLEQEALSGGEKLAGWGITAIAIGAPA